MFSAQCRCRGEQIPECFWKCGCIQAHARSDIVCETVRSICDVEKNETLTVRWEAVALSFPLLGPDLNANVRECLVFSKIHQLPIKTANAATFDFDVRTRENWEIMTISLQIWIKRTKHKPSVQICHSASNLHRSTKRQISRRQAWHPPARWQIAMLLKCCLHSCKSSVNDTKTFSSTWWAYWQYWECACISSMTFNLWGYQQEKATIKSIKHNVPGPVCSILRIFVELHKRYVMRVAGVPAQAPHKLQKASIQTKIRYIPSYLITPVKTLKKHDHCIQCTLQSHIRRIESIHRSWTIHNDFEDSRHARGQPKWFFRNSSLFEHWSVTW